LRDIFGVLSMAEDPQTDAKDQSLMPTHKLGERRIVILAELLDEQGIGLVHQSFLRAMILLDSFLAPTPSVNDR
jgi:hypothetical protein